MKKIMLSAALSVLLFSLASAQSYRVNRTIEEKRKVKVKEEAYGKNIRVNGQNSALKWL